MYFVIPILSIISSSSPPPNKYLQKVKYVLLSTPQNIKYYVELSQSFYRESMKKICNGVFCYRKRDYEMTLKGVTTPLNIGMFI